MGIAETTHTVAVVWISFIVGLALFEGIASWWVFKAQTLYRWFDSNGMRGVMLAFSCYIAWPVSLVVVDSATRREIHG